MKILALCLLLLLFQNCQKKEQKRFREHPAAACGIHFQNLVREDSRHNMIDFPYVYNGGGAGLCDLDGDGLPEVVFSGNQTGCQIFKNLGNFNFQEKTATAFASQIENWGWCTGITFADLDADGRPDIHVARSGNLPADERRNLVFLNRGNLVFEERAAALGLADTGWTTQAAFLDFDRDGDLDCYLLQADNSDRYPNRIKKDRQLDGSSPASDRLLRNDGGKFTDISKVAGIADDGWGLGIATADFNRDGWTDLLVTNDFLPGDLLYLNQHDGTFKNIAAEALDHSSHFSMGCDAADVNNDGCTDFFVADMLPATNRQRKKMAGNLSAQAFQMALDAGYQAQFMRNTLQLGMWDEERGMPDPNPKNPPPASLKNPFFVEVAQLAAVHATDWSWSPIFADLDLDGWQDLIVTSGYRHDIIDMDFILQNNQIGRSSQSLLQADAQIRERAKNQPGYPSPNRFFKNRGGGEVPIFSDETQNWTSAAAGFSNGSAVGDLDGDGDLDLIINNLDAPPTILENLTIDKKQPQQPANFLKIKFAEDQGLGARVEIFSEKFAPTGQQNRHLATSRGYQSSGDFELHFGLGEATVVDSMRVLWADGSAQIFTQVAGNQTVSLSKTAAAQPDFFKSVEKSQAAAMPPILKKRGQSKFRHAEQPFNDFDTEPLLPHKFSREGPALATADLDGDGREDFFVGGGAGQLGAFFLQKPDGSFWEKLLVEPLPKLEEDVAALLFDADADGDADLLVVSGGSELEPNAPRYAPRLFLNDGKANFLAAPTGSLPPANQPGSCAAAADLDGDGDLDLFVGGRRASLKFGLPGRSFLLENDGHGRFRDVSDEVLKNVGMVTAAQFFDVEADGDLDLALVGEAMPLTIFRNEKGKFLKTEVPATTGFWRSLAVADLDSDGDLDLAAGNIGANQKFNISPATPLQIFSKDFDGNGYFDPFLTYFIENQSVVLHGRDELMKQLPRLRKKFTTYAAYADARPTDIFSEKELSDAAKLKVEICESSIFLNDGRGNFSRKSLPRAAQTAPICALLADDLDGDGRADLLAVGNDLGWEPSGGGRLGGSRGWVLRGEWTAGDFSAVPLRSSGFFVAGEGRGLRRLAVAGRSVFVVVRSGAEVLFFEKNKSN